MHSENKETRHTDRIGWLRAAVLGANDGILSTSSIVLGVAARMRHIEICWLQEWPVWLPGRCQWQQGSMFLSIRKKTPNALI